MRDLKLAGYEPLLELATGGMATVYLARKVGAAGFERLVVIKRVHAAFVNNRDFSDMFRDEARMCATIRHPNVVQILDVVEADGELLLVLEYVESLSLGALSRRARDRGEALPPEVVVRIMADALAGLHAAHEAKDLRGQRIELIHRDVSPQNIIVGVDGSARLIDFGIAKAASRISVTSSGVLKGKLSYMSPEQVRRQPLDRRADIFAAGVVLFEALTGRKLFTGDDEGDVVLGILITEIPPASSLVPGLPPVLDEVLGKALTRDREERYRTAAEFQEALERALTPAPARDVGRIVESFGRTELERRRAELLAIFDGGVHAGPVSAVTAERPTRIEKSAHQTASTRTAPRIVTAGMLVVGVAAAAVVVHRTPSHPVPVADAASAARASVSAPAAPPPVQSATLRDLPAPPAASSSSSSSPSVPTAKPAPPRRTPANSDLHRKNPYGPP